MGSIPIVPIFFLQAKPEPKKQKKNKGRARVEPATYRAATDCSTTELTPQLTVEAKKLRQPGVEPGAKAWEASMLPIHHWRVWEK